MPTRTQLTAKTLRIAMEILADSPQGMHRSELWDAVNRAYPQLDDDWATYVNDKNGPLNNFHWRSTGLVNAGSLFKDGNGTWRITGIGHWALKEFPDQSEWWSFQQSRYNTWYRQRPQFLQLREALGALPDGAWVATRDIGVTGLDPSLVVHHVCGTRPEGWHRLLDANGSLPKDAHFTEEERALVERLLNSEGTLASNGRAPTHQRISIADFQQLITDAAADPDDDMGRRAWLVRGSDVQGYNLVRSLWLSRGICSLPASRLREIPGGSSRQEIAAAVADAYAHVSSVERDRLAREFHAFLSRMRPQDIVVTNDGASIYLGVVQGPPGYTASSGGRANLQRPVTWHHNAENPLDYTEHLPAEAANLLTNPDATLIDLTEFVGDLEQLLGEEPEQPVHEREFVLPDAAPEFADALLVDQDWLQELVELLRDRSQLIFYGPPGTGKTYIAQELAKHLTGGDPESTQLVQFHPSYAYEDFFEGYRPRPAADGQPASLELVPGPLRKLADAATRHPSKPFVLIIDEINRGNLAKVFGELFFLLEYRDKSVNLLYGSQDGRRFTLPRNIIILGTMNTADRSIALLDPAMRRRFWFQELHPSTAPIATVLRDWLIRHGLPNVADRLLVELNRRIEDRDFQIGPSFLMREAVHSERGLHRVWRHQILPLLEEHHFGDGVNVEERYGLAALRRHLGLDDTTVPGA